MSYFYHGPDVIRAPPKKEGSNTLTERTRIDMSAMVYGQYGVVCAVSALVLAPAAFLSNEQN